MFKELGSRSFRVAHVESIGDAEKYLVENLVDIVLLDLGLEGTHELEMVRRLQTIALLVSIALRCDASDESIAAHAIQGDAQDYLN